jgi:threonylcarbamoyladenosine tRNA methylthiotransferase CDKAL1
VPNGDEDLRKAKILLRPATDRSNINMTSERHSDKFSPKNLDNASGSHDVDDLINLSDIGSHKIWIEAYGCSANVADSQAIAGMLSTNGYEIVNGGEEPDLNIIVTCSVKDTTEHRMLSRIRTLSTSGKPLIIAGCLAKTETAKLEKLYSGASLVGPRSLSRTLKCVKAALKGRRTIELQDVDERLKLTIPRVRINPIVSIVQIGIGCMSECSFCQTKLAKGWVTSYRVGDIVRTIEKDVGDGCKEVWLSSTDNGCYGFDIGTDLVDLLKKCKSIVGDFKIRIGMMNPMYMSSLKEGLIQLFEDSYRIYRFLHVPVQSGSTRILRAMRRGHTARMYSDIVRYFRNKYPDITIGTDIIVGFPSESETDFEKTLELISESKPDIVNCSRYSARPGTSASLMAGRLSSDVAKKRSAQLHELCTRVSQERNMRWMGWQGNIVIDEMNLDFVQGRNYAYKPIFIRKFGLMGRSPQLGDQIQVRVGRCSAHALEAEILD